MGWTVCAEAKTGREAMELIERLRPDVAILDIVMPELSGIEVARRIPKLSQVTEVLILSAHYSERLALELTAIPIRGYVLKSDCSQDLLAAIETVARHKPFLTPSITTVLRDFEANSLATPQPVFRSNSLTTREREILQLLCEGNSTKNIASVLDLSVKTAETHRANIMRKMHFHNVADVVRYGVRNLIIEP